MKEKSPFHFQCPLCDFHFGCIDASTQDEFDAKIANHIILRHEDPSALQAVNRARLECTDINCSLGKSKTWDSRIGAPISKWTEYDKTLLKGMHIDSDQEE